MKKGTLSIIICMIIWGISFVNIKVAIEYTGPMTLGFIRFFIASILLYIISRTKGFNIKVDRKDIKNLIVTAFFGITLYFYFENNGVKYSGASVSSLIISGIPIFTLIGDRIVYNVKMNKLSIFAVVINVLGVLLIIGKNLKNIFESSGIGYLYMIGAVFSWVAFSLVSKKLYTKYSAFVITLYQSVFGTMMFFPFVFFEKNHFDVISPEAIVHILILAVFASAVGMILYTKALDQLGVFVASLYLNLIPIITVIAGYILLGEKLNSLEFIGGLLILFSVTVPRLEFSKKSRNT